MMKSTNELTAENAIPENWQPMLELAVREVFEIMLGCKLEPPQVDITVPNQFTAMVGLAGQLCGVVTLRCSAESAAIMTSKMLGIDAKDADQQMWDALGEISNMIAGNFKNKLTGLADGCMLSVPTVITGGDYTFHSLANSGSMEVTFLFEQAPISVSLEVHS